MFRGFLQRLSNLRCLGNGDGAPADWLVESEGRGLWAGPEGGVLYSRWGGACAARHGIKGQKMRNLLKCAAICLQGNQGFLVQYLNLQKIKAQYLDSELSGERDSQIS